MPKIVDHEERRKHLAEAVLSIVARSGVSGVTTRAVAQEAGVSTGQLTHYFGSRHDLLLGALRRAGAIAEEHRKRLVEGARLDGRSLLGALFDRALPLDASRLAMIRIFLFFYAEAASDEKIREEIDGYLAGWREDVMRAFRLAREQGEALAVVDVERLGARFCALADGLAIHAVLDPTAMALISDQHVRTSTWQLACLPGTRQDGAG